MGKNVYFFPTVESCNAVKLKRFPSKSDVSNSQDTFIDGKINIDSNNKTPTNIDTQLSLGRFNIDLDAILNSGTQYQKFSSTAQAKSLNSLKTHSNFNPRDIVIQVLSPDKFKIQTKVTGTGANKVVTSEYVYGTGSAPPVTDEIHISPSNGGNAFELDITHEHSWGSSGSIFDKILKGASELVGAVGDFITSTENLSNSVLNNQDPYKQLPNRRIDVAETYVSTEKQSIVIPFTLFTAGGEDNFVRDVYGPIMFLTQVSYPKRSNSLGQLDAGTAAAIGGVKGALQAGAQYIGGTDSQAQPVLGPPSPTKFTPDESGLNAVNSINPGFRVFVSDPPSYINVFHNGGLFSYKNCYITKFSYKFKYWVDGDGKTLKDNLGQGQQITDARMINANIAYPLVAECTLEIKTTEPLFADDFVTLAQQYSGTNRASLP